MSVASSVKSYYREAGMRGVVSGALRYAAARVEGRKSHQDEYLGWVRFAVPGMINQGNIDAMDYAIANMPAGKPVVEIGSFCGLSTVALSYLLDKRGLSNTIYTCDKWEFEGQQLGQKLGGSPTVTHDDYRAHVKGSFIRNLQTFASHRLPYTIECFSDEFFRRWFAREQTTDVFGRPVTLGGDIGFSFIDGNHMYDFAKRDFENTDRALVAGGFILFDDSADGSGWEVNRLTREIAAGTKYDLILTNPNYLFRKR